MHGLANAAANEGFFLKRWTQVVNTMIYKKPGCIELEKLQVTHLFEADFNLTAGLLFSRRASHHHMDNNATHQGQHGQPGGECQDVALAKSSHCHICHYT